MKDTLSTAVGLALGVLVIFIFIGFTFYLIKGEQQIEHRARRYFRRKNKPLKEK